MSDDLAGQIARQNTWMKIRKTMKDLGMKTLEDRMKEYVRQGETTLEERVRKVDGDVVDKETVECGAVHGV